jgi:F-type H+-transporting ATPase subunit delta
MTELTTLARPYAEAAYKRAKETGLTDNWTNELGFLSAVMSDERMRKAVSNPKVRRDAFSNSFLGLCEGRLDAEGQNFVRLLIQNQRLNLVGVIADLFAKYRAEDEGYVDVDVASAFDLSDEEKGKLSKTLDATLGRKSRLNVSVDKGLIGGVYIQAGDRVIDASVRGQIERLAKSLWN